ncbi:MAG: helix-turn-helix domain-containing protein [Henriciella sp.]
MYESIRELYPGAAALSINQFCCAIGCSRVYVSRLIKKGELKAIKRGSRVFIPMKAIEEFCR